MAHAGRNLMLTAENLLAIVAHDLKNPVSGILSAAEYLREDAPHLLEPEHLAVLQSIESSSRQMLGIIEELAEIAAFGSDRLQVDGSSIDLVGLIQRIINQHRPAAEINTIAIELKTSAGALSLEIDSNRIQQAIHRLLAIAVRIVGRGSRIELILDTTTDDAIVSIYGESGRANVVRHLGEAGTGLAVALIERVAAAHGGALECGGEAGGGQLFRLTLPLPGRARSRRAGVTGQGLPLR